MFVGLLIPRISLAAGPLYLLGIVIVLGASATRRVAQLLAAAAGLFGVAVGVGCVALLEPPGERWAQGYQLAVYVGLHLLAVAMGWLTSFHGLDAAERAWRGLVKMLVVLDGVLVAAVCVWLVGGFAPADPTSSGSGLEVSFETRGMVGTLSAVTAAVATLGYLLMLGLLHRAESATAPWVKGLGDDRRIDPAPDSSDTRPRRTGCRISSSDD